MNEEDSKSECALCGKALAVVGLVLAGVFLYMSVDVFSNGRLSGLFVRSVNE